MISNMTIFESVLRSNIFVCVTLFLRTLRGQKRTIMLTGERRYRWSRPRRRNWWRAILRRRFHYHDPPRNLQRFLRASTVRFCSTKQIKRSTINNPLPQLQNSNQSRASIHSYMNFFSIVLKFTHLFEIRPQIMRVH